MSQILGGSSSALTGASLTPAIVSHLSKIDLKQNKLLDSATQVLDGDNLVKQAASGLRQQKVTLEKIEDLTVEASKSATTQTRRIEIGQEINKLLKEMDNRTETVRYGTARVLKGDVADFSIQPDASLGKGKIDVQLTKATTEALGIKTLDVSTSAKATAALTQVNSALNKIDKGYDKLVIASGKLIQSADRLQKALQTTLQVQNILNDDQAVSIAESIQASKLSKTFNQNESLLSNIQSLI